VREEVARILLEAAVDDTEKSRRSASLLPVLQRVQRKFGYIPQEAVPQIAEFLQVPPSRIVGVASFYSQFRFSPAARNCITVCRGTACHVRGSARLLDSLSQALGIGAGETSKDLSFSLDAIACFGSCALAPVVLINEKVHGRMDRAKLLKTVEKLRAEAGGEEAAQ
jgi:NADH-quinone oxidoreductase subunit E